MKKEKDKENETKADFPRITLDKATSTCQKILDDYAGVVSYEELSNLIGSKGKTKGGKFSLVIKALKLYDFIDRTGKSEAKLTDDCKTILRAPLEEKKKLLYHKFLSIPQFRKIYDRYPEGIPQKRKAITSYVQKEENMAPRDAGRLVGMFLREYAVFSKLPPSVKAADVEVMEEDSNFEEDKSSFKERKLDHNLNEIYKLACLVGALFPTIKKQEIKKTLDEMSDLSTRLGFQEFSGFINGIKFTLKDKEEAEISEDIKKLSDEVHRIFKKSVGISE